MNRRQYQPNSESRLTTAPRVICEAGPMFATMQESRGALSAETDSENRNTLTNPLTWRDRQMVGRSPCAARFASLERCVIFLWLGFASIVAGVVRNCGLWEMGGEIATRQEAE